jgi:O-antigen/teichoic acid export membrane protein
LRNFVGLILVQFVSQGCNFGLLMLLTSALSPEQFGSVVFAQSIQTVLLTVATSGFAVLVVRDLSLHPERADNTITDYLALAGSISVLCGIAQCVWAAAAGLIREEQALFAWFALANVFAAANLVPVYDAAHRQSLAGWLQAPCELLGLGVTALLAASGTLTLSALGSVIAGRVAIQTAVLLPFLPRFGPRPRWRFEITRTLAMLRSGWLIGLATLLYLIPNAASIAVVRFHHGPAAAASYGLAAQFAGYLFVVFSLAVRILQPHIAGPHGRERSMILKVTAFVAGCVLVVGLLVLGGGYVMFTWVLNDAYALGIDPFAWLLLGTAFLCATSVLAHYLIAQSREWTLVVSYAVAVAVFGLFMWLLGTESLTRMAVSNTAASLSLFVVTATMMAAKRPRCLPEQSCTT